MKLYTEEQVRKVLSNMLLTTKQVESIFEELNPIEIPSDEEIEIEAEKIFAYRGSIMGFERGAKWMKEQILNK
jgi:hypothetical protein